MPGAQQGLNALNWAVIFAYLFAMLFIGWWVGRRVKSASGYQVAEGRMGSVLVGLSLLGTYLSALTVMALPGKAFSPEDWLWAIQLPFLLVTALVITRFVLPVYRTAGVISVYQFLELRIHVVARVLASLCFLALSVGRSALTLYLPALAFAEITQADLNTVIIVMGVVTTLYTAWGGIEAVIWTDAVQVIIFMLGAVLSVLFILWDIHAVGGDFGGLAAEFHKFRIWEPSLNFRQLTSAWLILQTLFETIRIYGTQQDMTQRYVAAESTRAANRSVWISILGYIPLGFLYYFIGSALFIYYQTHPDPYVLDQLAQAKPKYDAMYPHFIATRLPVGVKGTVLAAIFAAAMSTISSCMNSGATVCIEDFYKRFWPRQRSDAHYLWLARGLTLLFGVASITMAFYFGYAGQSAQDMWSKVMSYTTTGVLALMAFAFLPIRLRPSAAIVGWIVAFGSVWYMTAHKLVHFLLYPVLGNLLGFAAGLGVQVLLVGLQGRTPFSPEEHFPLEATKPSNAPLGDSSAAGSLAEEER
ncbi:MAG: sodium:solute symporter family transporter [Candidatus Zipacnadales bacterium]